MSYFEIGIYGWKEKENIGTLWRSAYQLGAAGIFLIGNKYNIQPTDTYKSYRHIPLREYADFDSFLEHIPRKAQLICVEQNGTPLQSFKHPKQAIYLLGPEDFGLPKEVLAKAAQVISLESVNANSYNVAVTGSIVMYHRTYFANML